MTKQTLPTLADLTQDIELAYKNDQFNLLLNQEPPKQWVKSHPYIKGHNYLPIDKVEYLLRRIFKTYKVQITGQGSSFNGVWVTVRLIVPNPAIKGTTIEMDGIGAVQLQTKQGTSPADLQNINNGALSMAYPLAKTLAIKDAADGLGKIFGADLNRKDVLPFTPDEQLFLRSNADKLKAND
jgi:hypothetical protein